MFDSPVPIASLGERHPADLDDDQLLDAVEAWDRVSSWATARQLEVIAELARRRPRAELPARLPGHGDAGHPGLPAISEFAVDEVAAALRLSRVAAGTRLLMAVSLAGPLTATAGALRLGDLDLPKARAIVEATASLDDATAQAVEARVLPGAPERTLGQLRSSLARAVVAADPAGAEMRHQRAVLDRRVVLTPMPDGMAELWALLPADGAAKVYAAVDATARAVRAGGRGMDARRADALMELVTGGSGPGRPDTSPRASVDVTVPAVTALGLADDPGELAGYGPVPASVARRVAADGGWRRVLVDPATGVVVEVGRTAYAPSAALADLVRARDRTCRFPGCRQPARRCDLDHVVPWPAGPTTAANLAALCRHHHRLKHQSRWTVELSGDELTWTSPVGRRYRTGPPSLAGP